MLTEPNADPKAYYLRPEWNADYPVQEFRKRYFGEITQIDSAFGSILDTLDEQGLRDNTVVIFTSDHGEMAGAQGMFGKGVMYDESMRVPLIVRMPEQVQGQLCNIPISTVDFFPTFLELASIEKVETEGRSLLPLFNGQDLPKTSIFSEYIDDACIIHHDGWKFFVDANNQPVGLYNIHDDPYELNNRLNDAACQSQIDNLTQQLNEWINSVRQEIST